MIAGIHSADDTLGVTMGVILDSTEVENEHNLQRKYHWSYKRN